MPTHYFRITLVKRIPVLYIYIYIYSILFFPSLQSIIFHIVIIVIYMIMCVYVCECNMDEYYL